MAPISMTLSDLECHFSCFETFFNSYSLMNMTRINYAVCRPIYVDEKVYVSVVFNRNCFPKLKDFSRLDALQAVTYTVKVAVSKKWHAIDTLLLHITNMAYLFVPFPMTLDDLEGHSPNAGLIKCNSTNICATCSTVLSDTARRVVPRDS